MIMPRGEAMLLPAKPWFIRASLLVALLLSMWIDTGVSTRAGWVPDLLALTLAFWSVHQRLRVGVGTAFVLGLLVDVHQGALLGQHALAYSVLAFGGFALHRRLLLFTSREQALQMLPVFVLAHLLQALVRLVAGHGWPPSSTLLAPLLEAALWPLAHMLLLAPQRLAHDPDEHRPI